jgi:hypothetical protein
MADSGAESNLFAIIKSILPDGSNVTKPGPPQWDTICRWPPDLFATMATLAERSGLYSEPPFVAYWVEDGFILSEKWIAEVTDIGRVWARTGVPSDPLQSLWHELIHSYGEVRIDDIASKAKWKEIVFRLLAIADEACAGIGFQPDASKDEESNDEHRIQYTVYDDYGAWEKRNRKAGKVGGKVLPNLPHSLCIAVPPTVRCVQPKTNTPAVGCTVRSLTHHVALLPSIANVSTSWHVANTLGDDLDPFNIMVVPFPYSIPGTGFKKTPGKFPGNANDHAFKLDPDVWMKGKKPTEFAKFLCDLITETKSELRRVHAIALPEAALRLEFAVKVAKILASKTDLDLFLVGVIAEKNSEARNLAAIYRFVNGKVYHSSYQSKHHRWGLTGEQIRRYHLGHILDPHCTWWEQIDVKNRSCYVTLFRAGASLSVLICEDLARYDPVLTVMNAIGPNLVVALLMDGPQLEQRWPGRYATALAEDPGSTVLTLTSLGMVERSSMPGEPENREIALWKEPNGKAKVLKLPKSNHALLLTLTSQRVRQFTLDGRDDGGNTVRFGLGAARPIRHPKSPSWLQVT